MSDHIAPIPPVILDMTGRVAADIRCVYCGYNLRTQPVTGRCPECGQFVAQTTAGYVAALDDQGHVAIDLPCVDCGYNLRTQPATGRCPECAAPVARSALGHYLHLAAPQWVRRLANGALLLVIALCTVGGASLLAVVVGFVVAATAGQAGQEVIVDVLLALMIVIAVVSLWFIIRGLVCLTAREPTTRFHPEGLTARKVVRYALLVLPLAILGGITLMLLQIRTSPFLPGFPVVTFVLSALVGVVQIVVVLATLRHIARLMRRVPRRGLAIFAKVEFWGLLASGIVYIGSSMLFFLALASVPFPAAFGPNVPVPPYALGPNAPATTSAPGLTSLGYAPSSTVTVTQVGPDGVTTTTTMPAAPPVAFGPSLPFRLLFPVAAFVSMAGSCSLLGFGIAGLVLLILVWRALASAARLAEASALADPVPRPETPPTGAASQ